MPEISVNQMAMAKDATPGGFLDRLQYAICVVARDKLQAADTNELERNLATRVVNDPAGYASRMAVLVVTGPNLIGKWDPALLKCTATDAELYSQVWAYWPYWA